MFSKTSEGLLDHEAPADFARAWWDSVSTVLERRVAGGHTLAAMDDLVEEIGLDKFLEILEHFFGLEMDVDVE